MQIWQQAALYIWRRKQQSCMWLAVLSIALAAIYTCLTVNRTIGEMLRQIEQVTEASASLSRKDGRRFSETTLNELRRNFNLELINRLAVSQAMLPTGAGKVFAGKQTVQLDNQAEVNKLLGVYAVDDSSRRSEFLSGRFKLTAGRHLQSRDRNEIMVHESLAQLNGWKLGDTISLSEWKLKNTVSNSAGKAESDLPPAKVQGEVQAAVKYRLVGIFAGVKEEHFQGFSSDLSENTVFTSYNMDGGGEPAESAKAVKQVDFWSKDKNFLRQLQGNYANYLEDAAAYQVLPVIKQANDTQDSFRTLQTLVRLLTLGVIIAALSVSALILLVCLRNRIREIGILLAVGRDGKGIIRQLITEQLYLSLPAILLAAVSGPWLQKQLAAGLMSRADTGGAWNFAVGTWPEPMTLLASYSLLAGIIISAVIIGAGIFLRRKPREILAKMS